MKRRFTILTAAIALLTILAFPMGMWGQTDGDFEFNLNQLYQNGELVTAKTVIETTGGTLTFTDQNENFTILITRNSGNQPGFYTSSGYIRFYNSDTFKLSSAEGITITKVVVTPNGSSFNVSAMTGLNASTRTWTGSASEITFTGSGTNKWDKLTITYTTGSSSTTPTTVTIDATGITNTDVYEGSEAGSLVAIVKDENNNIITGATVSWESSNEGVATINANGEVTLVAAGTTTITANYDGDEQYGPSFNTYELEVTDSTPFTGGDVTFDATKDKGTSPLEKNGVTFACDNGVLNNGSEYRLYKNSVTTFSVSQGSITQIVFSGVSGNPASGFATQDGWTTEGNNGTWTGNSNEVSFTASGAQVRATLIVVTVDLGSIPDPSITAENISIEYNVTSGDIEYTINNAVDGGTLTANTESDWLTLGLVGETVPFTCAANTEGTARTATVTLTYTYGDNETVTKDVTVTQAAAPVIYTTIPALFEAATSTATEVTITFGGWVISAVNNSNAYLTDNQGNGLIIYASDHGFQVNDVLTGTVSCKLQTYRGSAELTQLTNSTEGLTVTNNGTVTEQSIAISELGGVNTGALLAYQGLTYNGTALVDDNNNSITPYSTLYSYTFEDGKTYNVKGIYLQYNSTKELLPRSAEDVEEVVSTEPTVTIEDATIEVAAEGDEGILTVQYENITEIVAEVYFCDAEGEEATYDWITAEIDTDNNVEWLVESNEGEDRTAYFKVYALDDEGNDVYSNLVTVIQAAYEAPITSGTGTITFGSAEGSTKIDGTSVTGEDNLGNTWTISTVFGSSGESFTQNPSYSQVGASSKPATSITLTTTLPNEAVVSSFKAKFGGFNGTAGNVTLKIGSETVGSGSLNATNDVVVSSLPMITGTVLTVTVTNISKGVKCYYISYTLGAETYTLTINGYASDDVKDGYYLIASPVSVNPATVEGMTAGDFDLYYYDDTQDLEWRNYEAQPFNIVPGKGYLYAKKATTETPSYTFSLTGTPYNGQPIQLIAGWNLIGNPYAQTAYIEGEYYVMNGEGSDLEPGNGGEINAKQGIFVNASEAGTITFSTTAPEIGKSAGIVMNVSRNRGNVIDRAIVRFDEGRQLPKFQLNPNNTKIYVTEGNQDFAVVRSANEGEMPVSFKAAENGTYTINVDVENMEMDYLHLIDNMTGADVDLLQTPSYSFEASTRDYASRFRLVFSAEENGASAGSATFAYFNGNEWVVSNEGDAQLHVIDMTGRIVSTETLNGNATVKVNAAPGVYMLRLVNGNDIKTQKVIIK